jgi:hypothetical protein
MNQILSGKSISSHPRAHNAVEHGVLYSFTHSLTNILSPSHLTHSLTHSLTNLLTPSLTHSRTNLLTPSLTCTPSLTNLLTSSPTHSFTYSLLHLLIPSLTHSIFVPSTNHSITSSVHNLSTHIQVHIIPERYLLVRYYCAVFDSTSSKVFETLCIWFRGVCDPWDPLFLILRGQRTCRIRFRWVSDFSGSDPLDLETQGIRCSRVWYPKETNSWSQDLIQWGISTDLIFARSVTLSESGPAGYDTSADSKSNLKYLGIEISCY